MTNNMASLSLWKMLYLLKLHKLLMAPVLCDVWQLGCYADNMEDGITMKAYEMHGTCWGCDMLCHLMPVCGTYLNAQYKPVSNDLCMIYEIALCAPLH